MIKNISPLLALVGLVACHTEPTEAPPKPEAPGVVEAHEEDDSAAGSLDDRDRISTEPLAFPDYLAETQARLEIGQLGLVRKNADELLAKYPDDPWVLAAIGFAKASFGKFEQEGKQMLADALERTQDRQLRAQILYRQARVLQKSDGMMQSRDAVVQALKEGSQAVVQRNLEVIDGAPMGFEVSQDEANTQYCERRLANTADSDYRTCIGTKIGDTLWIRESQTRQDGPAVMVVFHEWRLASPAPENPERLRSDFGDPADPISDIAVCSGTERLTLTRVLGGEGAVLSARRLSHNGESYIAVECRTDEYTSDEHGIPLPFGSSTYTMVCSLDSGWCSSALYTHEQLQTGGHRNGTVEVEPGKITYTQDGKEPRLLMFP